MEKSYKYRIYPNKTQQELIQKTFGCCRYIYNYFLNKRMNAYKEDGTFIKYNDMSKELTLLKKDISWLTEPDKCALQNSIKDLDNAYRRFFKHNSNYPKFKTKKNMKKSYRTQNINPTSILVTKKYIKLPKLGYIKTRDKQLVNGRIINATITQECNGHYYVSICCTDVVFDQLPKTNKSIGIDLGIVDFATLSDGTKIDNPRFFEKSEKKLAKLQRELSRKSIGGSNRNKARLKVAKLQKHIAEQRKDFLQKLTTTLVNNYDTICIEDLDVSDMKETCSHIRNKHVNDVSFYEFRRQLEYKCKWYGKDLITIDRYYPSSQICHVCGHKDSKKSTDVREWICHNCHCKLDRDINAAINILNEGLNNY